MKLLTPKVKIDTSAYFPSTTILLYHAPGTLLYENSRITVFYKRHALM